METASERKPHGLKALFASLEARMFRRRDDAGGRLLSSERKAQLEQAVEDMLAVAEVQGTPGWQVLIREVDRAEKVAVGTLLHGMDVHRFAGKRGIEKRGEIRTMRFFEQLALAIVERGGAAQRELNEDRSARAAAAAKIVRT